MASQRRSLRQTQEMELKAGAPANFFGLASDFGRLAAADAIGGQPDQSIAHAGIALEMLAKAYLAQQHLLLVVGDSQGKLNLDGVRWALRRTKGPPTQSRTITAAEAIRRCEGLLKDLDANRLRDLVAARNGVLHMGKRQDATADASITALAHAVQVIAKRIGRSEEAFWGSYAEAVAQRLDAQGSALARLIADRRAQALVTVQGIPPDQRRLLGSVATSVLETQAPDSRHEQQLCPVCETPGLASGELVVEWFPEEDSHDSDGWMTAEPIPVFFADRFQCFVCRLELEDAQELEAAGMDVSWRAHSRSIPVICTSQTRISSAVDSWQPCGLAAANPWVAGAYCCSISAGLDAVRVPPSRRRGRSVGRDRSHG